MNIKVIIKRNQSSEAKAPGKRVEVCKEEDTMMSFLERCAEVLEISPKWVYNHQGVPVHVIHELTAHEVYFISEVSLANN